MILNVVSGKGGAAERMTERPLSHWAPLGYSPWPGSLNLEVMTDELLWWRKQNVVRCGKADYVPVEIVHGTGRIRGHLRFNARKDRVELLAPAHLRTQLQVEDGGMIEAFPREPRTRVIIQAAGTQRRWNNYQGVPKHLVPVPRPDIPGDEEPLLRRTVRLVRQLGIRDIVVMGPPDDERYELAGTELFRKVVTEDDFELDQLLPEILWNDEGRTLFLSGDMYYTTRAMQQIVAYDPGCWCYYLRYRQWEWRGWLRPKAILGFSLPLGAQDYVQDELLHYGTRQAEGTLPRTGGYDLYRLFAGESMSTVANNPRDSGSYQFRGYPPHTWVPEPDDASQDFDWPKDYNRFLQRFSPERDG